MEIGARRARLTDLKDISMLAAAFRNEQRVARGGVLWDEREAPEPDEDALRQFIDQTDSDPAADVRRTCLVATIDDVVLAFAAISTERIRGGQLLGRVELLFVEVEARMVGVGEALMAEIKTWCGEQHCTGIDAYALPGERLTKNFFESNGFVARLLTMHHRLQLEP